MYGPSNSSLAYSFTQSSIIPVHNNGCGMDRSVFGLLLFTIWCFNTHKSKTSNRCRPHTGDPLKVKISQACSNFPSHVFSCFRGDSLCLSNIHWSSNIPELTKTTFLQISRPRWNAPLQLPWFSRYTLLCAPSNKSVRWSDSQMVLREII